MIKKIVAGIACFSWLANICAQNPSSLPATISIEDDATADVLLDSAFMYEPLYDSVADSLLATVTDVDTLMSMKPVPASFYVVPPVFVSYILPGDKQDDLAFEPDYTSDNASLRWLEDALSIDRRRKRVLQYMAVHSPSAIYYNVDMLPDPPEKIDIVVDPKKYTLAGIDAMSLNGNNNDIQKPKIGQRHWMKTFASSLQFSQAYVSPNWYQGGNNNVNMLLNLNYNVKLNQKFHPDYLFETTVQYKLGMNSAPDDTIRSYNISEDILQIYSTFGYKAIKKWYYTVNAQFKTQLFNSFTSNTNKLRSAFLSPGELNAGIGMTYNTSNQKKTFALDASISPLSYNWIIVRSDRMNRGAYNIEDGHRTASKYGSSVECKLSWKIARNISLNSRLFAFTDYDRGYADLENTIVFEINRYLTTQVYAHLRYDSHTPFIEEGWHKLQVKEILSLGFAYKYSTI